MSLSTNSWDVVYISKLDKIAHLKKNIFKVDEIIVADSFQMSFTKSEVYISTPPDEDTLVLKMTIAGKYSISKTVVPEKIFSVPSVSPVRDTDDIGMSNLYVTEIV